MREALRSVLGEPAVPGAPGPTWWDRALVGGAALAALIEAPLRPDLPGRWPTLAVTIGLVASLLWRRSHPLAVMIASFGFMAVLSAVQVVTGHDDALGLYASSVLIVTLYALCRWASGRDVVVGLAVAVTTTVVAVAADSTGVGDAVGGGATVATTAAIGLAVRFARRARERELDQVRLVEREHLARDLHDTVAHHVSAIVIRANVGLAVAVSRPEAVVDELGMIRDEATRALAEMRAVVGVLRGDEAAERAPAVGLDDLRRLGDDPSTRPHVTVAIDDGLDAELSPTVATTLYRLAQESVTNARRHARRASHVAVTVRGDGDRIRLRVVDDGERVGGRRPAAGYGIAGMAERAGALGGRCDAGPGEERGWVVSAELPWRGSGP